MLIIMWIILNFYNTRLEDSALKLVRKIWRDVNKNRQRPINPEPNRKTMLG